MSRILLDLNMLGSYDASAAECEKLVSTKDARMAAGEAAEIELRINGEVNWRTPSSIDAVKSGIFVWVV